MWKISHKGDSEYWSTWSPSSPPEDPDGTNGRHGTHATVPQPNPPHEAAHQQGPSVPSVPSTPPMEPPSPSETAPLAVGDWTWLLAENGVVQNKVPYLVTAIAQGPDHEWYVQLRETATGWRLSQCERVAPPPDQCPQCARPTTWLLREGGYACYKCNADAPFVAAAATPGGPP